MSAGGWGVVGRPRHQDTFPAFCLCTFITVRIWFIPAPTSVCRQSFLFPAHLPLHSDIWALSVCRIIHHCAELWPGTKDKQDVGPIRWPRPWAVSLYSSNCAVAELQIWGSAMQYSYSSIKEVIVFAGVGLFICLLATLLKKFLTDFDKIFRIARQWYREQLFKFRGFAM